MKRVLFTPKTEEKFTWKAFMYLFSSISREKLNYGVERVLLYYKLKRKCAFGKLIVLLYMCTAKNVSRKKSVW